MSALDVVQIISLIECALTVPVWWVIGRVNRRVGWWAAIPIGLSLLTGVFYVLVVWTDLNERYRDVFTLISALLRVVMHTCLLFGGVLMTRRYRALARSDAEHER